MADPQIIVFSKKNYRKYAKSALYTNRIMKSHIKKRAVILTGE